MSPSSRILASSTGAVLDTDLRAGGGTDDTAALQAVLDRAREGDTVHLVLDGPALVSGLDVYGNTTIEGGVGAGFYLKSGSDRAVLRNAHRSRDAIQDRDITIRGVFISGNRDGQQLLGAGGRVNLEPDGSFKSPVQFFGVERLVIEDVTVWNPRSFGIWVANASSVTIRDTTIDSNYPAYPGDAGFEDQRAFMNALRSNLDGIHFNGPAHDILIERVRLRTEDDALALNANDCWVDDLTIDDVMGPYVGQGPITDVVIRDVHFDDALQGLRMLSSDQRIDRILFENATGTVRHRMTLLGHYGNPRAGDYGSIVLRNLSVRPQPAGSWHDLYSDWYQTYHGRVSGDDGLPFDLDEDGDIAVLSLNARIEHLRVEGLSTSAVDARPVVRIGRDADIGLFDADIRIDDPSGVAAPLVLIDGHRVADLRLSLSTGNPRRP